MARQRAAAIKVTLGGDAGSLIAVLKGPVLAEAVEQVLTATATPNPTATATSHRAHARTGVGGARRSAHRGER
ncbi:hypothetical protein SCALM49S_03912 [Streptomyces californicus]